MKRKNLINMRTEKGYTQEVLAEKVEITTRHYKSLEAGTSNGSIEVWKKLKKILNAPSVDYLLEQRKD